MNQFFGFLPIGGGDIPEEVKAEIKKQRDLHDMNTTESLHRLNYFFDGLDKDQLITVRGIIDAVEGCEHGTATGAFLNGRITEILRYKHGLCPCNTDHDAELAKVAPAPSPEGKAREEIANVDDIPIEKLIRDRALHVATQGDITVWADQVQFMRGWVTDEASNRNITDQDEIGRLIDYSVACLSEFHPHQAAESDSNWKNPLDAEREAKAKEYGVAFVPLTNNVVCLEGCGGRWVSLEDRMLRPPGKDGCDFCKQREKWG